MDGVQLRGNQCSLGKNARAPRVGGAEGAPVEDGPQEAKMSKLQGPKGQENLAGLASV
jgi:hypothetical protein